MIRTLPNLCGVMFDALRECAVIWPGLGGNISTCFRVMSFTGKVVLMHEFLASLRIDHGGK